MLDQRLHLWPSISPALGVSGGLTQSAKFTEPMLDQCWTIVRDAGPTLKQHWVSVWCFLVRWSWPWYVVVCILQVGGLAAISPPCQEERMLLPQKQVRHTLHQADSGKPKTHSKARLAENRLTARLENQRLTSRLDSLKTRDPLQG